MFWSFQVFGQDWTAEQNKIWSMQKTEWELWKKGDTEARKKLFHEDCVLWYAAATFPFGRNTLEGLYNRIESYDLQPLEIKITDNIAIVQYLSKWSTLGNDHSDRVTNIWMNQDGKWKIIGSMSASCLKVPSCP
jgi:hypothetical protein